MFIEQNSPEVGLHIKLKSLLPSPRFIFQLPEEQIEVGISLRSGDWEVPLLTRAVEQRKQDWAEEEVQL